MTEVSVDEKNSELNPHLKEESVGIYRRLTSTTNCLFKGKFKQRYSDFVVNEIDEGGEITRIVSVDFPVIQKVIIPYEQIQQYVTSENLENLKLLESGQVSEVNIDVCNASKEDLRAIHNYIRQNYEHLDSKKSDNIIKVVSTLKKHRRKRKIDEENNKEDSNKEDNSKKVEWRRNNNIWPYGKCKYVHFVMYKENMTTHDALNKMAKLLNVQVKRFSIAGNKDKQGKTSQCVSVFKIDPKNLLRVNQLNATIFKHSQCLLVGNFNMEESNKEIRLGCLQGNNFVVAIREFDFRNEPSSIICDDAASSKHKIEFNIENLLKDISERGFVNFFGIQRFGFVGDEATSHKTGIMIIKKQHEQAINNILKPKSFLSDNLNSALDIWHSSKDPDEACLLLNRKSKESIEGFILTMLKNDAPNYNYKNIIMKLPRNTRNLYIHAYQSYLWNKTVSYRIQNYGMNILIDDVVYDKDNNIHKITQEDIDSKNYSILDVYMSLASSNLSLPPQLKEYTQTLLEKDGIEITHWVNISKDFNVTDNTFRKVIVMPSRFFWRLVDYVNDNDLLIEDSKEIKQLKTLYHSEVEEIVTIDDLNEEVLKKALILDFNLPSSSYATVLLGEIVQDYSISSAE